MKILICYNTQYAYDTFCTIKKNFKVFEADMPKDLLSQFDKMIPAPEMETAIYHGKKMIWFLPERYDSKFLRDEDALYYL